MKNRLLQWFAGQSIEGGDESRIVAILTVVSIVLEAVCGLAFLGFLVLGADISALGITILVGIIAAVLHIFLRRGRWRLVSWSLPALIYLALVAAIYNFGSLRVSSLMGFSIVLILSALAIGETGLFVFSGLIAIAMIGLFLAESNQYIQPMNVGVNGIDIIILLASVIVILALLRSAVKQINAGLQRARSRAQELDTQNVDLERRVAKRTLELEQINRKLQEELKEHKETEKALHESLLRQSAILDNIPDLAWLKDEKSRFIAVNGPFGQACGMAPQDLAGKTDLDIWPEKLAQAYRQDDFEVMRTGKRKNVEERLVDSAGQESWIQTIKTPILDDSGQVIGTAGIARDITHRKTMEDELLRSRNLLQSVLNTIPIRVFWKDRDLKYLGCNQLFAMDAGVQPSEGMIGKDDYQMGWREQAEFYRADDRQVMESGQPKLNYEEPQTTPDGSRIWLRTSKIPLKDADGRICGVLGTYEDVTERRKMEDVLRDSEIRYRAIVESTTNLICRFLPDTTLTFVNTAYCQYFGKEPRELVGMRFLEMIPREDRNAVQEQINSIISKKEPYTYEHEVVAPNGEIRWQQWTDSPILNDSGQVVELQSVGRDITESKVAEKALRESERRFREMLQGVKLAGVMLDEAGCITFINDFLLHITGWSQEEAFGANWFDKFLPEELREGIRSAFDHLMAGEQVIPYHENEILTRENERRLIRWNNTILFDSNGKIVGSASIGEDITERRRVEQALITSEGQLNIIFNTTTDMQILMRVEPGERLIAQTANRSYFEAVKKLLPDLDLDVRGKERSEFLKSFGFPVESIELETPMYHEAIRTKAPVHFVNNLSTPLGDRMFQITISPIVDQQGTCTHMLWSGRDITEEKRAEEALRENQTLLAASQAIAHVGSWDLELPTKRLAWSDEVYRIFGVEPQEFDGTQAAFFEAVHPDERVAVGEAYWSSVEQGRDSFEIEHRLVRKHTGEIRHVHEKCIHVRDAAGAVVRSLGMVQDITERKHMEELLVQRAAQLEKVAYISSTVSSVLHVDALLSIATTLVKEQFGYYHSHIYLLNESGNTLALAAGAGEVGRQMLMKGHRIPLDHPRSIVARAAREKRGVIINDVRRTTDFLSNSLLPETCSELAVPLIFGGQVMGVFDVQSNETDHFTAEDIHIQTMLAGQIAVSIQNAREFAIRKQTEERLFEEKERAEITLHSIGDAVITVDIHELVEYLNPVAENLTGWRLEEATGQPLDRIFRIIEEASRQPAISPVKRCLQEDRVVGLANHSILISRDGREYSIDDSAAPIRNRNGDMIGAVLVFHDVTEERRLSRKVAHDAMHDSLTGLVNRREFEKRLERALLTTREQGISHILCYLDLDQFKIVNDTAGHAAGDELLRQLSSLLGGLFRQRDTFARLGGDEFGLLLENCQLDQALVIANEIKAKIRNYPFVWAGHGFHVGVSIGVVPITSEKESVYQLMSEADVACYSAKDQGRDRVYVYHVGDNETTQRHSEIFQAARMHDAIFQNRFRLFCQPIVQVTGESEGIFRYEILLRMADHDGRLIFPGAFIPSAERYGEMQAIDRWVIRESFLTMAKHDTERMLININISSSSLDDETLLEYVLEQLREFSIPPEHVCFEITETVAIRHLNEAQRFIRTFRAQGGKVALDDFGSGFSSFRYLQTLSVDYIKIDGGFVSDMLSNPGDLLMVDAITKIAHTMGIKVIAEHASNIETIDRLREMGVDYVQGFGIGLPVPVTEAWKRGE